VSNATEKELKREGFSLTY